MRRCLGSLVCLLAAFGPTATASDLMDAYSLARQYDPRLGAARYQYEAAKEAIPLAKANLLPNADFHIEHLETNQDIKSSDNAVFAQGDTDFPTDNYTLTLNQPLFRFGDWAKLKQSKAEVQKAFLEFTAAEQSLMLRIAELYLGVLAAKDNLRFAESEKAAVKRQLERTSARKRAGLATRTDLYDAEARFSRVEADEIEARNLLDDSYEAMRESIGIWLVGLASLKEEIPLARPDPSDIDGWVESALSGNLALKARQQAYDIAHEEVRLQKAGRYPSFDFVARLNNRDTDGTLFGGGSEVETADYSLQFRVPLYSGGAVSARIRQAVHQLGQTREELKLQNLIVSRETRSAYLGVISGINRVQALQKSIIAQDSALEVKQKGYPAKNTMLDVLDAERDLYLIKRDYAQARYDYVLNTLRLKQATGMLSEQDLEALDELLGEEATAVEEEGSE